MGGPEMAPQTPQTFGAPRHSRVAPLLRLAPGPTGGVARRESRVRLSRRVVPRFRVYFRRAEYGTRFRYPNVGRRGAPRRQPRGGYPRAAGGESRRPGPERRERRAGGAEEQPVAVVARAHGARLPRSGARRRVPARAERGRPRGGRADGERPDGGGAPGGGAPDASDGRDRLPG